MAKVRTSGTDIELALSEIVRPLWKIERYRKNVKNLPGKPDIVFPKSKIAIFADGDFWHGRDFEKWSEKIPEFWRMKILSNIERDKKCTLLLKRAGYRVLRFWGTEIKKNPGCTIYIIEKWINKKYVRNHQNTTTRKSKV